MRVAVLTLSDKGARGERVDQSGPHIREKLREIGAEIVSHKMLPDDIESLVAELDRLADVDKVDIVLTTGGTGLGPRDITPEATREAIDREAPGLAEAIRQVGLKSTPRAMLSRGTAGIRGTTLIVNLPGSLKGAEESLAVILPILGHAVEMLRGAEH